MSERADEILEGAIRVIERDGWHQGSLYKSGVLSGDLTPQERVKESAQAPVCALGAMYRATSGEANYAPIQHSLAFIDACIRLEGVVGESIPDWNDHRKRTKEDVILAFKRALHEG